MDFARKLFIAILLIVAGLLCIPMAYREIWRWRTMQQRAILLQKHAFDPMDVIYIAARPYTTTAGIKAAARFKSTRRQILTRWFVAYATSIPALFVLSLGLAGLFACLCQYILLRTLEHEVPALADQVGDFAGTVVTALNNASEQWAIGANSVISSTNAEINSNVFGWVNTTTTALNDTLNAFTDQMSTALNETFGGTILYDPITEVLNCLIGLKIAGIEKGLTWVSDNAQVTFPEFRNDTFSLGAAASLSNSSSADSFLSSPGSVATDDITSVVVRVADVLAAAIREEAIISTCIVLVWVLIVLIGLIRVGIAMLGRDKTRAEGGPIGYTGENRAGTSARASMRDAKFPGFEGSDSSMRPMASDEQMNMWDAGASPEEKVGRGHAGQRSVDRSLVRMGHERKSSYGYMGGDGNAKSAS